MNHQLLSLYLDLLLEASSAMNLTSVTDRAQAQHLHIDDALTLLPFLPASAFRLADVGSGGGCPGIPLAIARPDAQVVLIESTAKKAAFLSRAAQTLGLANITVLSSRAEDAARGPYRESFDIAAARAVGSLAWVAEFCLPLVKIRGKVLAMKGPKAAEELPQAAPAIAKLGGGKPHVHATPIPGGEGHVLVEIPKIAPTDPRYPRPPTQTKGKSL